MTAKPRVLFVIKALAIHAGGAERVLCEMASELAARGNAVEIASFDGPGAPDFYPLDPRVRRERLGIGDIQRPTGTIEFIRKVRQLRALLVERRPQVAVGFMHSAFVPLAVGAIGSGVPVIASEHAAYAHYDGRALEKLMVRAVAPLCARFTATLESIRRDFPASIGRRMTVIANPISPPPCRRRRHGRRRLLFVGNFRAQKDHRTLIAAFARLAPTHSGWDLRLVGGGDLQAEVEKQVRSLGLESRVNFISPATDISDEYAAADLFVVPSVWESFGLAAAEALAMGIPVVGFADCPGINELIVDGRNGLLVEGSDRTGALAAGLDRLIRSEALRDRLGRRGPPSVDAYSLRSVADRWEELVASIASKRAA